MSERGGRGGAPETPFTVICPMCERATQHQPGPVFICQACTIRLQYVVCPHCWKKNLWSNVDVSFEGSLNACKSCSKQFRFFNCSRCRKIKYWTAEKQPPLSSLMCTICSRAVSYIHCDSCREHLVDPRRGSFQDGYCYCRSCIATHQYIRCPHCSTGHPRENVNTNAINVIRCESCDQKFTHMRCCQCRKLNISENGDNSTPNYKCYSCKKDMRGANKIDFERSSPILKFAKFNPPPPVKRDGLGRGRDPSYERDRRRTPTYDNGTGGRQSRCSSGERPKPITCGYFDECREFVKHLHWSPNFFAPVHDHCYCRKCYSKEEANILNVAGADYIVPRDWAGFGLGVDPHRTDNLWESYVIVYHGTTPLAAQSILDHRQFLLPGDHLIDGTRLEIRKGHIPGKVYIYTSPSIAYAGLDVYSPRILFHSLKTGILYRAQIVLQARQKPGTFRVQGETIGWERSTYLWLHSK